MSSSFLTVSSTRLATAIFSSLLSVLQNTGVFIWDLGLTLFNVFAPLRPANRVVLDGYPGAGGVWPQYIPPREGDSRSCCPALNAMANHGILPRDGRNISFRQMNSAIRKMYNFSPTFCFYVPDYAARMLNKSYWTDTFDLEDLSAHNCIEHDASLTRKDTYHSFDQSKPDVRLIRELLACGTGPDGNLTIADLSRILGKRRAESKKTNGQYSQSAVHKLFGSSNSSTLLTIFGGKVQDLAPILLEERIPNGWQPRIRRPWGLTLTEFQLTVLPVEFGIKEEVEDAFRLSKEGKKNV